MSKGKLMSTRWAIAALAECYRASGADPDGMEDWRLAQHAVEAVKDLRRDYDAETRPLLEALDHARKAIDDILISGDVTDPEDIAALKGILDEADAALAKAEVTQ